MDNESTLDEIYEALSEEVGAVANKTRRARWAFEREEVELSDDAVGELNQLLSQVLRDLGKIAKIAGGAQ